MNKKSLIISIIIPLFVGSVSSFLSHHQMNLYKKLNLPPLAPPGALFPVVWTILFILMGISSYFIYVSSHPRRENAIILYAFQLFINFCWPLFFFNLHNYFLALVILLVLLILVVTMMFRFYQIKPISCYLNIPYLIWICFALYLNFFVFINN